MSTLTDRVLSNLYKDTALVMWKLLCNKYQVKDSQGIYFTSRKFLNCKQESNETVESLIERVFRLRKELEAAAHQVKDKQAIMIIFKGISQEYVTFVQCLTVNKSSSDLDLDEIVNALILEEKRINEKINENNNDQVYKS